MYSDYHIHSYFSFDSEEKLENIISQALSLKMEQICITDHEDINWPIKNENPHLDIDQYFSTISYLKDKYKSQIEIFTGVELGITKSNAKLCNDFIKKNNFDFVIGSCHIVDNMDPYYSSFWNGKTDDFAIKSYFDELYKGLASFNNINTLGHLDYIVRYSFGKYDSYKPINYIEEIDKILNLIISKKISLEINTSNFAKGINEANPHRDILKRYKELGGNLVTIGSDAHKASNIGIGFNQVETIIKDLNLKVFTL